MFKSLSLAQQKSKQATEMDRNLRYYLDADVLDCPICTEPLSLPVYQCENGHTICSACCKKIIHLHCPSCSQPTGRIRCLMVEKIIASMEVSCKHAPHGCKEMLQYSKRAEREKHEKKTCKHKPVRCLYPSCSHEASSSALPSHLAEAHGVRRMRLNSHGCVKFLMSYLDSFVMVEFDDDGLMLVHREAHVVHRETHVLGDRFFCSTIAGASKGYNLKVNRRSGSSSVYTMEASAPNIEKIVKKFCIPKEFLILPFADSIHPREFGVEVSLIPSDFYPPDEIVNDDDPYNLGSTEV